MPLAAYSKEGQKAKVTFRRVGGFLMRYFTHLTGKVEGTLLLLGPHLGKVTRW